MKKSNTFYLDLYPCGCETCHFHELSTISSKDLYFLFHPKTFSAFSLEATKIAGSPSLLGEISTGISCFVTFLQTSITSFTENPSPEPKLNFSDFPPSLKYSRALTLKN